jgi:hypothetical protein
MTDLFEKVSSYEWGNLEKNAQVPESERNKHREKVKEYTSFAIGRKFSENTHVYSQN